ncbi:polysaccharide deacetylase family protein [candidate division KSB1 bacterium]|nr:polysaccharide deacetylase family protein [candidate division KSB1 bacterium]NIV71079.1 polysaccharide deacetylase family protein [Phycisphaerae bacterium]NIR72358.1 polysaccharide deacetylase family protein [candidate division KSB1 bacterium]NIS28361.1 polysaccharide deacetylase family protein [candidate division KSB1 bacterium]NIT75242.1 polysaccharide deacetylase family protein [candidate division KSB1 bacterium]
MIKRRIKFFLSAIFYYAAAFHLIRWWNILNGKRVTILTFHRVTAQKEEQDRQGLPTISISAENFESLIRFLIRHYRIISMREFVNCAIKGVKVPGNSMIISFDDGYKELLENALPVLRQYELPAVLFVPTGAINDGGYFWWDALHALLQTASTGLQFSRQRSSDPAISNYLKMMDTIVAKKQDTRGPAIYQFIDKLQELNAELRERFLDHVFSSEKHQPYLPRVMTWHEIEEMSQAGWEIGSHTVNHQFLTSVPGDAALQELTRSKEEVERRLNLEVFCFSYPGGKYSEEIVRLVQAAGYACACNSDEGLNSINGNLFKLKRINISDDNVTDAKSRFSSAITAWHLFLKR